MDDANPNLLPPRQYILTDRVARGLGVFIFIASLLCVLFAATFPFDFSIPAGGNALQLVRETFDWQWVQYDPHYLDRTENILLFMPFGFGVASLFPQRRRFRFLLQIATALLLSFMLTTTVETSQTFISFRDPSLMDIWANTLGGVIGAIVFTLIGDRLIHLLASLLLHLKPLGKPAILGGVLVIYAALQLSAPLIIRNPRNLSNWDSGMFLVLGNRFTGDRTWAGKVSQIILADKAADAVQVNQIFRGDEPTSVFKDSLLADYRIAAAAPFQDRSGHEPPLAWSGSNPSLLRTTAPIAPFNERVARTWEFTLVVNCAPNNVTQIGPARVISVTDKNADLNVELGQEQTQLAVRLRTAVRSTPDMRISDVFMDQSAHQIILTVKDAIITVYVDGDERGTMEITPEAKVIWRLYPRGGFAMRMEKYGFRSYAAIYRLLVFIPFSALLGAMMLSGNFSFRARRIVAIATIFVMALLLETILGTQAASGFQLKNLSISLVVGLGALSGMWLIARKLRAR